MDKPEKVPLSTRLCELLKMLDNECRKDGGEAIAFVYSTEEETSVVPAPRFSEAEQKIIAEKLLPAVLEAGREIEELEGKNRKVV
jgi:hypothetical protein